MRVSGSLVALCCSVLAALAAAGPGPGQEVPGRAPQDPASTSWLDHRFTKQGATLNEIWSKVVPFMTVADAGHDLPTGQLLLLGWCGWMAFLCVIAAWVVRAPPSPAFAPGFAPPARGARSRRSVVCLPDRSARIEVVRVPRSGTVPSTPSTAATCSGRRDRGQRPSGASPSSARRRRPGGGARPAKGLCEERSTPAQAKEGGGSVHRLCVNTRRILSWDGGCSLCRRCRPRRAVRQSAPPTPAPPSVQPSCAAPLSVQTAAAFPSRE